MNESGLFGTAPEVALLETIRTADGIALVVSISNRKAEMSRFPGHTDPGEVMAKNVAIEVHPTNCSHSE